MPLKLGDQIPDFSLSDQLGVSRTNKQAKGRPLVLFFYPKDFTFVCPSELHAFQNKLDDFKQRNYGAWAHPNKEGTDYNTVANILSEYAIDHVKRDEERHKAFEFWKSHCDAIDVYTDIINKTKNTLIVEKSSGLEEFFG